MQSEKPAIKDLASICAQKGLRNVVISPGSRNAPLIISFTNQPAIQCTSIADERSAAFFAMGIAQQLKAPVALTCTSGSAALNYAPGLAEAYYQHVPLVVFTADRPTEWIDQGDGQTIRQRDVFANHIKKSFELPQEAGADDVRWHSNRIISEAINLAMAHPQGPVHINIPLKEPLYQNSPNEAKEPEPKIIQVHPTVASLNAEALQTLATRWNNSSKKLLIVGQGNPNARLSELVNKIAADPAVTVLTETTSNLFGERLFPCTDRLIHAFDAETWEALRPDLLITFGGAIVSKRIKAHLRKYRPSEHWHIDLHQHPDTFQSLTDVIALDPADFFEQLLSLSTPSDSDYYASWKSRDLLADARHAEFLKEAPHSDLKVFEQLLEVIPENSDLHLANSSPIRYVQLFKSGNKNNYSNRGTSGIDGSISTAVGMAFASQKLTTIITGDLSFFYDSNALWNHYLSPHLRIILINNAGGGIFRIIDGPTSTDHFETYFEATHQTNAAGIAATFGVEYQKVDSTQTLATALAGFFESGKTAPQLLEIDTPQHQNAVLLKQYFEHLKTG